MKRIRRSIKRKIVFAGILLLLLGTLGVLIYWLTKTLVSEQYQPYLLEKDQRLLEVKRWGFVSIRDIALGEVIKEGVNVIWQQFESSQPQSLYLEKNDSMKISSIEIKKDTQIIESMVQKPIENPSLREVRYEELTHQNVASKDWCDLRLLYPNGENYIVLSKKQVINKDEEGNGIYFWLTEEEIQQMSSAMVDAYLFQDSKLYLTKYIVPQLQEASVVTYVPSIQTIQRIKDNPNIIKIASNYLTESLREMLEQRLTSIDYEVIEAGVNNNKYWNEFIQEDDLEIEK